MSQIPGHRWAERLEQSADAVLDQLIDLDPTDQTVRRTSDGRSLWIEPTAPRFTSEAVLAQEEAIVVWAMEAQADPPAPSSTVDDRGLDSAQPDAAAAVAGDDRLVLVVGPAGAGKTRMLAAAGADLDDQGRVVFAVAPTAKAARVLERDTGMLADTVAKLLHEWHRSDRPPHPQFDPGVGATLIVDEAGMLSTPALHQLVSLADSAGWRVVLVGDPRQLQGVGRGGLLGELCANGRVEHLDRLHRFRYRWEAEASLLLRAGDPRAFDAYEAHGRIISGTLDEHLARIADTWMDNFAEGRALALVASTNDHVDTINDAVQQARLADGQVDPARSTRIAGNDVAEARDILDAIVAVDRADTPAVAQRRTLAHQQHHQPVVPAAIPRCAIPDWFQPLLDDARAELASRQQDQTNRAIERQQLEQTITVTEQKLSKVDALTRPERRALDLAERDADDARQSYHAAVRRLESSTWRSRRAARHDVGDTKAELQQASDDLADTRRQTAPSVERYTRALAQRDDARRGLRQHDTAAQFHQRYYGVARAHHRVNALETWKRWATGLTVSPEDLGDTIDALVDHNSWRPTPEGQLGQAIETWAVNVGISGRNAPVRQPTRAHVGIELEL